MADDPKQTVPRYDLVTPLLPCKEEILRAFERFLVSGRYILGEEVELLEKEMADACGVPEAVGVSSGSSALYMALAVAGVGPGTEVITTPYTFVATTEAIVRLGATPVFVDIRPTDLNLDPGLIEDAITDRTRAICPVHIFGAPCDMDPILAVAGRHGVEVIVDMAQAFGTIYAGRPCGSYGRMSSLSFYPTKNLPAIGDAGVVLCRDPADAAKLRMVRGHDPIEVDGRIFPGFNYRIDEVQAMVVRIRLARFKEEQRDRDTVAGIYERYIPASQRLITPNGGRGMRVTYHQYWVRSRRRDRLRDRLAEHGVQTGVYYDPPLHAHPLGGYCRVHGSLAEAERAGAEILTLPIHSALPERTAHRIGEIVAGFLRETDELEGSGAG